MSELRIVESRAEVLDLSHDCTTPFRLQFDDPSWQQFVDSLKPLGLAILLNTCNPSTQEKYAQFCAHLSCLGLFHEDLIPVTNRRYFFLLFPFFSFFLLFLSFYPLHSISFLLILSCLVALFLSAYLLIHILSINFFLSNGPVSSFR